MGAKDRWETIKNEARPYAALGLWIVGAAVVTVVVWALR